MGRKGEENNAAIGNMLPQEGKRIIRLGEAPQRPHLRPTHRKYRL